jgi:hypothetical protein
MVRGQLDLHDFLNVCLQEVLVQQRTIPVTVISDKGRHPSKPTVALG